MFSLNGLKSSLESLTSSWTSSSTPSTPTAPPTTPVGSPRLTDKNAKSDQKAHLAFLENISGQLEIINNSLDKQPTEQKARLEHLKNIQDILNKQKNQ